MGSYGHTILLFVLMCIIPFGIGLIVIRATRKLSLSISGKPANQIDAVSFIKTYAGVFNIFHRKTDDKVDALITLLNTPFYPVHNPQRDPAVSNTNTPKFIPMLFYNIGIKAIVAIGNPAVEYLIATLSHPNLNVRIGTIKALGRIGNPSAIKPLTSIIQTPESNERAYAVSALGKIKHQDIFEQMISFLHDPDVYVREAAVSALGEMGNPQALPELETIARSDHALVDRFGPSIDELAEKAIKKIRKNTRIS